MKAVRWYEKGDIRIDDIREKDPGPGEVRIRVSVCGICGSDLHEYKAGPFLIPRKTHPLTGQHGGPVVLGHEFSGVVDALGAGVADLATGQRVVVNPLLYCRECYYCSRGEPLMCRKLGTLGFAADGAFADSTVVPRYGVTALPDHVDDDAGAFIEPLAVAVRAVKRARLNLGQSVVVVGAGPIGLLVAQVCRATGAAQVFVVEPMEGRRELARRLGATVVIDPRAGDPGKIVAQHTDKRRADVAIDCVGIQASFDTAVNCTGRRAVICIAGMALEPIQVPFLRLWGHEKEITFTQGYENEFPAAVALLSNGQVHVAEMITARIDLDNLLAGGIETLLNEPEQHVKILVYPRRDHAT